MFRLTFKLIFSMCHILNKNLSYNLLKFHLNYLSKLKLYLNDCHLGWNGRRSPSDDGLRNSPRNRVSNIAESASGRVKSVWIPRQSDEIGYASSPIAALGAAAGAQGRRRGFAAYAAVQGHLQRVIGMQAVARHRYFTIKQLNCKKTQSRNDFFIVPLLSLMCQNFNDSIGLDEPSDCENRWNSGFLRKDGQ